ncbi:MAG: hypothetical protein ACR2JC_16020 [Chloroflexota bacterium]
MNGITRTDLRDSDLRAFASLLQTEGESSLALMIEQMRAFTEPQLDRLAEMMVDMSTGQRHLRLVLAERDLPRLQAAFLAWLSGGTDWKRAYFSWLAPGIRG